MMPTQLGNAVMLASMELKDMDGVVPALMDNGASNGTSCSRTLDGAVLGTFCASDAGDIGLGSEGAVLESKGSWLYCLRRYGTDSSEVVVRRLKYTPRLPMAMVFSEASENVTHGYNIMWKAGEQRVMESPGGTVIRLHMSESELGYLNVKPETDPQVQTEMLDQATEMIPMLGVDGSRSVLVMDVLPNGQKDSSTGWYTEITNRNANPVLGVDSSRSVLVMDDVLPSSEGDASAGGANDCGRGQTKVDDGGRLSVKEYLEKKCSAAVTAAVEAGKEKRLEAARAAELRGQPFAKCTWKETIRQHEDARQARASLSTHRERAAHVNETRQLRVAERNGTLMQPQASSPATSSPATLVVSLSQRPRLHGLIRRGNARRAIGIEQVKRIARMYADTVQSKTAPKGYMA